jgi:hypothetical protein
VRGVFYYTPRCGEGEDAFFFDVLLSIRLVAFDESGESN